jgi:hypothetical protein
MRTEKKLAMIWRIALHLLQKCLVILENSHRGVFAMAASGPAG